MKKTKNTVTRKELAALVGVTIRQVATYCELGMPRVSTTEYDAEKCLEWISQNIKPTGRGDGSTPTDRAYWETYKVREQALVEELKRRKTAGELIEVDTVARLAERQITHAKALLEQIPERLLGLLPKSMATKSKTDFRNRANEMIEDVLFALSEDALEIDDLRTDRNIEPEASDGVETKKKSATARVDRGKCKVAKRDK